MTLTKIGVASLALVGVYWAGWYTYDKIQTLQKANTELSSKLETMEQQVITLEAAAKNLKEQQIDEAKINKSIASVSADVKRLRNSIGKTEAVAATNPETCSRSISVAGGLLGDCAERYSDVAGKAERLKSTVKALDNHVEILEGLSPLKPLGASNGSK